MSAPLKFKKDFRNLPPKQEVSVDHVQQGLEKLRARRGYVPAYNEKESDTRPRDLNGQLIEQGGRRRHKSKKRSSHKRKTRRRR
jgi:hypothetical protein